MRKNTADPQQKRDMHDSHNGRRKQIQLANLRATTGEFVASKLKNIFSEISEHVTIAKR